MGRTEEEFKIVDKRKANSEETGDKPADKPDKKEQAEEEKKKSEQPPKEEAYEVSFDRYILSLATQAFFSLGLIENPVTKKIEKDIPSAKYIIDLMELIQKKTKGNLDENEEKILGDILYDLRMKYVQTIKK